MLVKKFNAALQNVSDVLRDPYLANLSSALADVEAAESFVLIQNPVI